MPRAAKFHHPLREVRLKTTQSTQAEFARLVGVSTPTIQAVENGKMPLSKRVALRVERATGARHEQLMKGESGRALAMDGSNFSKEAFEEWQQKSVEKNPEIISNSLGFWTQKLIQGAALSESDLTKIHHQISDSLNEVFEAFSLSKIVHQNLHSLKRVTSKSGAISEWNESLSEADFRLLKNPLISPDTRLSISVEILPSWNPSGPPPDTVESS